MSELCSWTTHGLVSFAFCWTMYCRLATNAARRMGSVLALYDFRWVAWYEANAIVVLPSDCCSRDCTPRQGDPVRHAECCACPKRCIQVARVHRLL